MKNGAAGMSVRTLPWPSEACFDHDISDLLTARTVTSIGHVGDEIQADRRPTLLATCP
jgi:hypothetical protein